MKLAVARPRVDQNGDVACGNVMTKGGEKQSTCDAPRDIFAVVDPSKPTQPATK